MKAITQRVTPSTTPASASHPRPKALIVGVALWCIGTAAFAVEPGTAKASLSTVSLVARPQAAEIPTSSGSTQVDRSPRQHQPTHDDDLALPKPGIRMTLLAVMLLMGLIGKRRSSKALRIASSGR